MFGSGASGALPILIISLLILAVAVVLFVKTLRVTPFWNKCFGKKAAPAPDDELTKMKTVGDIVEYLEAHA